MKTQSEVRALCLEARAHWVRMWKDPLGCEKVGESPTGGSCVFCTEFADEFRGCPACPLPYCGSEDGSVWEAARFRWIWMHDQFLFNTDPAACLNALVDWRRAARDMIDLIDSVTPMEGGE